MDPELAGKMVLLAIVAPIAAIFLTGKWTARNGTMASRIEDGFLWPIVIFPTSVYSSLPYRARVATALVYGVVQAVWFVATVVALAVLWLVAGTFLGLYQLSKDIAGLESAQRKEDCGPNQ